MFKYCLIDTRQCLSNQWIILTGLTYIISSIPDVIFFSSYRGSIADFIILSFSNQYYFLLIILGPVKIYAQNCLQAPAE